MHIIGNGFISRSFEPLRAQFPDVLLFGAGVSNSLCEESREFRRDADLLYSAVQHCLRHGLRLVYFSSAGMVYGNYEAEVREDGPVFPRSAYGRHKLAMETVIRASGVRHLILRIANPVGPNQQRHQLLPALYDQVRRGYVEVWSGAHRDLIDIDDVVRLTGELLASGCEREVFNLASGQSVKVEAIVDYLEQRLGAFVLRNHVDRGDFYRVCIDKMRQQLSPAACARFTATYYQQVIDTYLQRMEQPICVS
ncbi:MAG: NAD-dependent epimerase/dehydratase family protein [Chloroflexaceae bacterium]|jgi:nucleoside-diphosphate-sugar epimerase|nr:NAD-dependent epimerase/dehydratase family protein [Chloroflexaceae bacterium]